jgi:serine/threonine-protein phosphatase 5
MFMAFEELKKQNNVQEIKIKEGQILTICGDTHGRFRDVMEIFKKNGPPRENHIYVS